MDTARYLGIEIGGTKLQLVAGSGTGDILETRRFSADSHLGGLAIRQQIARGVQELAAAHPFEAVGVGFGGPVDRHSGRIYKSHQVEGWSGFDLRGWLYDLVEAPVWVDNDANVAALGEAKTGAGVGCDPVFYITLGSGVGGGLIQNGSIYHGQIPGESEIGHVRLDRMGATVESRCSGWAVDARLREQIKQAPTGPLALLAGQDHTGEAKYLASAVAAGDAGAAHILAELSTDLSFALSHVVHLFHPAMIILGGGLSGVGEPLRAGVQERLGGFIMDAFAPGPSVRLAGLGEQAVPVGALLLAAMGGPIGDVPPGFLLAH
jgi:glucokinase